MKYIITGRPGVGKSTLFNLIVETLRANGYKIGGIIAPEIRSEGVRTGFKLIDLLTREETWLAKRNYPSPVRVGSYGVLVEEANNLVSRALMRALDEADVVAIDEVGPMELNLPAFKPLLLKILDSGKPVILVIHYRLSDRDILSRLSDAKKIEVTMANRELLKKSIPLEVVKILSKLKGP